MEDTSVTDTTCLSCFRSHVKCEKSIPCRRCQRLNLRCGDGAVGVMSGIGEGMGQGISPAYSAPTLGDRLQLPGMPSRSPFYDQPSRSGAGGTHRQQVPQHFQFQHFFQEQEQQQRRQYEGLHAPHGSQHHQGQNLQQQNRLLQQQRYQQPPQQHQQLQLQSQKQQVQHHHYHQEQLQQPGEEQVGEGGEKEKEERDEGGDPEEEEKDRHRHRYRQQHQHQRVEELLREEQEQREQGRMDEGQHQREPRHGHGQQQHEQLPQPHRQAQPKYQHHHQEQDSQREEGEGEEGKDRQHERPTPSESSSTPLPDRPIFKVSHPPHFQRCDSQRRQKRDEGTYLNSQLLRQGQQQGGELSGQKQETNQQPILEHHGHGLIQEQDQPPPARQETSQQLANRHQEKQGQQALQGLEQVKHGQEQQKPQSYQLYQEQEPHQQQQQQQHHRDGEGGEDDTVKEDEEAEEGTEKSAASLSSPALPKRHQAPASQSSFRSPSLDAPQSHAQAGRAWDLHASQRSAPQEAPKPSQPRKRERSALTDPFPCLPSGEGPQDSRASGIAGGAGSATNGKESQRSDSACINNSVSESSSERGSAMVTYNNFRGPPADACEVFHSETERVGFLGGGSSTLAGSDHETARSACTKKHNSSARSFASAGGENTTLEMTGPFLNLLSSGEVAVERTRHLLTSWHLWSVETRNANAKAHVDQEAKEDLEEVAKLVRLSLPSSVAEWVESRGPQVTSGASMALLEEEEQVQSFLDMCADDDGSAICSAVYCGGRLQLTLNSRFAAMFMTLEEMEMTISQEIVRPELVWRRLLSPECFVAYNEALCQAYFRGQNLGGEVCEIIKCVDRFGLELPCFMRVRIFASSHGSITASVILLLPLQLSRLLENM
ncbi:Zn(2)-C6 fungal-type DNA-binding domain protein [Nannochloropsis gaditana]|uniref:Zn(2)-C6 fungal-type DNA-binding domain protein n=1 Tax=Nannochloropsis gaditana TaxID=72520 RepID=W7TQ37_9STRA|nr:Zn(2)-C6 fungal-type DNA-binding domain protein [Nannochloropsis gaditana]